MNDMGTRAKVGACAMAAALLALILASSASAQAPSPASGPFQKGEGVTRHATGTFEVKLVPQGTDDKGDGSTLGRMSSEKQIHGDLEGTSKGEMLSAMSEVKGSGAYVAVERVTGTLAGLHGSFALQHMGTMTRGTPQLTITVVPDSGSGELKGLTGRMTITIAPDGKHSYDLEYTLPAAP